MQAPALIDCDGCGKRHKEKQKVIECRLRAKKRAEKEAAKTKDIERRQHNAALYPLRDRIAEMRHDGAAWVNIGASIRRDYPPPGSWAHTCGQTPCPIEMMAGRDWDVILVIALDTEGYVWPTPEALVEQWSAFATEEWREETPWRTTTGPGGQPVLWPSDLAHVGEEEEYIEDVD